VEKWNEWNGSAKLVSSAISGLLELLRGMVHFEANKYWQACGKIDEVFD
jgi:hypothetical protein